MWATSYLKFLQIHEGSTPHQRLKKCCNSKEVFKAVGMNLSYYLYNCPYINGNIHAQDRSSPSAENFLGIQWKSNHTELSLGCSAKTHTRNQSSRSQSHQRSSPWPIGLYHSSSQKAWNFPQGYKHKKARIGWPSFWRGSRNMDVGQADHDQLLHHPAEKVTQSRMQKLNIVVFADSSKKH